MSSQILVGGLNWWTSEEDVAGAVDAAVAAVHIFSNESNGLSKGFCRIDCSGDSQTVGARLPLVDTAMGSRHLEVADFTEENFDLFESRVPKPAKPSTYYPDPLECVFEPSDRQRYTRGCSLKSWPPPFFFFLKKT
jgi:hypothetical protein